MQVGCICHHDAFYASSDTGEMLGKYLLVLAVPAGGDVVFRLLTSQHPEVRPPACHHGPPYPGFGLGIPGGALDRLTWVDLRGQDDYDIDVFRGKHSRRIIREMFHLDPALLRNALACAAAADDTSRHQARHIQDAMATLAG